MSYTCEGNIYQGLVITCPVVPYTGWMMMPYPPATTDEVTLLTSNLQYIYGLSLNQQRQQVVMDL